MLKRISDFSGKLLLVLAMALWMLHNIVPHHHNEGSEEGITSVSNTAEPGFLGLLLSWDLGSDHLENGLEGPGMQLVFNKPAVFEISIPPIEVNQEKKQWFTRISRILRPYKELALQRGPPSLAA